MLPSHSERAMRSRASADSDLFLITKKGIDAIVPGYESDMPPFDGVLTDDQITTVLAFIKSTRPQREREFQGARGGSRHRDLNWDAARQRV
jgi:hypothetical protein